MELDIQKSLEDVRVVDGDRNYWFLRTYGGALYDKFIEANYIGIGFNSAPQKYIKAAKDDKSSDIKLKEWFNNNFPFNKSTASRWANQLVKFDSKVKIGDVVIIPSRNSKEFSIGIIESDIYIKNENRTFLYNENYEPYPEKRRKVKWINTGISGNTIKRDIRGLTSTRLALTEVTSLSERIESVISDLYIKEDKIYLTIKVNQEEDINAFAFRDFLDGLTYFYTEFTKEKGSEADQEFYIKIKVQSKGKVVLKALSTIGVMGIAGLLALSKNAEFSASLKNGDFDMSFNTGDGFFEGLTNFLDANEERRQNAIRFNKAQEVLRVDSNAIGGQQLEEHKTINDPEASSEENNTKDDRNNS